MRHENMKPELVCDPACLLAEGPLWNPADLKLYFTDILGCSLWRCDTATGKVENFWRGSVKVGGFAFNRDGNIILCAENRVLKLHSDGSTETLFTMDFPAGERFNDITTDPEGRIFAGTMGCGLFRFEKGKAPVKLLDDIPCSNGMTFSLDLKTFYHTETGNLEVKYYDYDRRTGEISKPRDFFRCCKDDGLPDGLTIDMEGCFWLALWNGGAIIRISPAGRILRTIKLPAKIPTSVMFGGEGLKELFITTSSYGRTDDIKRVNSKGEFLGGGVYRIVPGVAGRAEWPTDF